MTAAEILAGQLDAVGGLVSQYEMAREWGWTRSHVHNLFLTRDDTPAPVTEICGRAVYARSEMEEWHRKYTSRNHRGGARR